MLEEFRDLEADSIDLNHRVRPSCPPRVSFDILVGVVEGNIIRIHLYLCDIKHVTSRYLHSLECLRRGVTLKHRGWAFDGGDVTHGELKGNVVTMRQLVDVLLAAGDGISVVEVLREVKQDHRAASS